MRGVGQKRWNLKFTYQPISRISMLWKSLLKSLFASSISQTYFFLECDFFCFFFFSLSFSCLPFNFLSLSPFCARMLCIWLCVYDHTLTSLRLSITKSLVRDARMVCVHTCAYSKYVETSHLPQRALCLQGCALPSLPLSSTEPSKCGCHSWSTSCKGELAFLWYTVVLTFFP